jgi:membrane associated rhomboid family serine protease
MVMPLYDDNPFNLPHRPIVTWTLILVNVLIFLAEAGSGNVDAFALAYGATPATLVGDAVIPGGISPVLTLVTYQFLHADFMHILGNMIFLWVFGDDVEEALGRGRFLAFYLGCGIIGALAFIASDAHSQSPLIGASGAISGIVIAYVMLRPCAKVTVLTFGIIPMRISAFWVVGFFVLLQFINMESSSRSDVAYWCHIGGMAAGAVLFPLMRPAGVKLFECIRPQENYVEPERPAVRAGSERAGPWG